MGRISTMNGETLSRTAPELASKAGRVTLSDIVPVVSPRLANGEGSNARLSFISMVAKDLDLRERVYGH